MHEAWQEDRVRRTRLFLLAFIKRQYAEKVGLRKLAFTKWTYKTKLARTTETRVSESRSSVRIPIDIHEDEELGTSISEQYKQYIDSTGDNINFNQFAFEAMMKKKV